MSNTPHQQTHQHIPYTPEYKCIVIRGLPGAGKTTLANRVAEQLRGMCHPVLHLSADFVRASLNSDLGFDPSSRIENARRLGAVALIAVNSGIVPVIDFIMPSLEAGQAFNMGFQGNRYSLWQVVRESAFKSRFSDTDAIYQREVFGEPLTYKLEDLDEVATRVIVESRVIA